MAAIVWQAFAMRKDKINIRMSIVPRECLISIDESNN